MLITGTTRTRTIRNLSGATFALTCLVQMLAGGDALARTTVKDCDKQEVRSRDLCVAESCGGACTSAAWDRCVRIGSTAWNACAAQLPVNASPRPPRTKPDFGPTQVATPDLSNPTVKPKGPQQGTPRPLSNPTPTVKPKGPQQATPRPLSNPSSGGPVLRTSGGRR